jgi:hypothetical protein
MVLTEFFETHFDRDFPEAPSAKVQPVFAYMTMIRSTPLAVLLVPPAAPFLRSIMFQEFLMYCGLYFELLDHFFMV